MKTIKFRAYDKEKGMLHYEGIFNSPNLFDNSNLMQFTGLLDKNGNEIYEGDIIKTLMSGKDSESMVVEWKHDGYMGLMHPEKRIVVGNIYENKNITN